MSRILLLCCLDPAFSIVILNMYIYLLLIYHWLEIWIYILLIMLAQLVKNLPAMQETQYSWTSLVVRLVNNMPAMRETGV